MRYKYAATCHRRVAHAAPMVGAVVRRSTHPPTQFRFHDLELQQHYRHLPADTLFGSTSADSIDALGGDDIVKTVDLRTTSSLLEPVTIQSISQLMPMAPRSTAKAVTTLSASLLRTPPPCPVVQPTTPFGSPRAPLTRHTVILATTPFKSILISLVLLSGVVMTVMQHLTMVQTAFLFQALPLPLSDR